METGLVSRLELAFFLNRNSMDDLNGRYIMIYIYLSDLSDLITKCTVGIHNPYEVEHTV